MKSDKAKRTFIVPLRNAWHKRSSFQRSLAAVALVVIIGVLSLIFVAHTDTSMPQPTSGKTSIAAIPKSKRYWIIGTPALNEISADPGVLQSLSNDTIFVPVRKSQTLAKQTDSLHIVPVESFTSEAQLANAVNNDSILPSVKALLYDNEDWSLTPANEQSDLVAYYQRAASLAHAHGYLLIGTPVSRTDPRADIQIAPYVDVLDIQSQYDQASSAAYAGHVLPLAKGARSVNPNLIILSGLSTNPPAGIPTVTQLIDDAQAVDGSVQGFWLNIPSPGTACPKCHMPQPEIGIHFLDELGAS